MPRPRTEANSNRARNVAKTRTATAPAGVFSQAAAARIARPRARSGILSGAEIFLIRRVILDQHAAVHGQGDTGDHARRVTGEENDRVGDVLGFAHAAQRDL